MLISARHLVDRLRHPRQRAVELAALRTRLARQPGADGVSQEERDLAGRLRELRERMLLALGTLTSCTRCAVGHPAPFGRWPGGHCCGSRTEVLFSDDELVALKLAGTTALSWVPPRSDLAGCVFRGPEGCSLDARDRPNLCVRYLCRDLERELAVREDGREVLAIQAELSACFARFEALRARARAERPPWE